jgi:predicted O-methyltransferase YrrM
MAEVIPDDGEVVALEIDPYLAKFGQEFIDQSEYKSKIRYVVGPAMESLRNIAKQCFEGTVQPFDLLMIDADRAGMMDYFNLFWWESPNMLGAKATVCIDVTPYKGQAPIKTKGPSCGDLQGDVWITPSGQDQIDSVRRTLEASTEHTVYTVAGLLVSHSREKGGQGETESHLSTPRRAHPGGPWQPRKSGQTHAANPLASFPNDRIAKVGGYAKYVPPTPSNPVGELRSSVKETDWSNLYAEGKTMMRVALDWCATEERCSLLRMLLSAGRGSNVLEVGGFVGMATLSMAEEVPDNGTVTSLEIDPFLVQFGSKTRNACTVGKKIKCVVGPAMDSLEALAKQVGEESFKAFDFVVIDADRAHMRDYFNVVWDTPGFLKDGGIVCIDILPFKGQAPVRHKRIVPSGQRQEEESTAETPDEWKVPSGQAEVDALVSALEASPKHSVYKVGGMMVVKGPAA